MTSHTYRSSRSHTPFPGVHFKSRGSVLNSKRRPLGYIDVAALKAKWEAGFADPVSSQSPL